jgi:hypothetical protein
MLRAALGDTLEAIDELLLRSVVLLTAPMARLYWKDYLGLDPAEAAATAGWAISTLVSGTRTSAETAARPGPLAGGDAGRRARKPPRQAPEP